MSEAVVRAFYAALDRGDDDATDALLADDFAYASGGITIDRARYRVMRIAYRRAMMPLTTIVESLFQDDDRFAVRTRTLGTQAAPFLGHPSLGRAFAVDGADFLRVERDRIARCRSIFDTFGMLRQLGH